MITLLAWILLIMNAAILIISLIVLFMQPKEKTKEPSGQAHVVGIPYQKDLWEDALDTDHMHQCIVEQIRLRYPEFLIMFEDISIKDACVFRFKGLTKRKESVLYVLQNEEVKEPFFSAVEQFIEEAKTPMYGIVIALPFTKSFHNDLMHQLMQHQIPIHLIMNDESSLNQLFHSGGTEAFIGVGRKTYAVFEVKNDNQDYDWLGELNSYRLFQPMYTKLSHASVLSIKDVLPKKIKFYCRFPHLFSKQIMQNVMHLYPETVSWFLPLIDKQDAYLIIYAPCADSLEHAIDVLHRSASKKNVSLSLIEKNENMYPLDLDRSEYHVWTNIIQETCRPGSLIPVATENHHHFDCECPVVSFAPLFQNKKTSSYEAIRYYKKLFAFKKQG